jgi:hypothetical protein
VIRSFFLYTFEDVIILFIFGHNLSLKMHNLGLELNHSKTILTIVEEEKKGLLKQIKNEQQGYEECKQRM